MSLPSAGDGVRWIRNAADLAAFRSIDLAVENVDAHLAAHRASLLSADVGAGKSKMIDDYVAAHRRGGRYDLVIYLAAERSVLFERPYVKEARDLSDEARDAHDVAVLLGRPSDRCGALDGDWRRYEATGCTALGRALCDGCPSRASCPWPDQLSEERLRGKRIVCATQAYLAANPNFVELVAARAGARSTLVIVDEAQLLEAPFKKLLNADVLTRSRAAFEAALKGATNGTRAEVAPWLAVHGCLLDPDDDLSSLPWLSPLPREFAARVQEIGLQQHGRRFRFLGYELATLTRAQRWRDPAGAGVHYLRRPRFDRTDCLIAAANVPLGVARRHFGLPHMEELTPGVRLLAEGTQVVNLRSYLGAARNFPRNATQILFAAAQLIVRRASTGHRSIVVTKKRFATTVARDLEDLLRRLSGKPYRVVHLAQGPDLGDPLVVPCLHYGVRGVNAYESFETAIALNSYNARPEVIEALLNDPLAPDAAVRVEMTTREARREAFTPSYDDQVAGYGPLAGDYHRLLESVWAAQTLGRVRFTVHPRLVVFFQTGPLPFPATEYTSLAAFCRAFGLEASLRAWEAAERATRIQALDRTGLSAREIAAELGVSVRTVRRYRRAGGDTTPTEDSLIDLVSPLAPERIP